MPRMKAKGFIFFNQAEDHFSFIILGNSGLGNLGLFEFISNLSFFYDEILSQNKSTA